VVSISIKRFFVRAKHWPISLLLIGPCLIAQLALANSIATPMASVEDFDRTARILGAFPLAVMVCLMGWFWSVGLVLVRRVASDLGHPGTAETAPPPIAPVADLSCGVHHLFFRDGTHKAAGFYEYSGPFFLIWFFPIGLWIIQPRINRLAERS
jgi:hypothetical protein